MSEETSMLELLNERLEKEDIVKLVCDYDNKFNKLEENNNQLKSQLQQKDKEIERLIISLQAQEELTMNWYNKVKKARDLFYEKCRISQNGAYIFNEVDYEELSNILGSDKE